MNDGSVAVDTNAVTGTNFRNGIRQNATGAFYGTTSVNASDVWVDGLRISAGGALVFEAAAATTFQNGDPATANGRLATA